MKLPFSFHRHPDAPAHQQVEENPTPTQHNFDLVEGGLYSVHLCAGEFGVIKVLVLEPEVVHIRIYKSRFSKRPRRIRPSQLDIGTIYDGETLGIGHMPIAINKVVGWKPRLMMQQTIAQDELEGYRMWEEARGDAF